MNIKLELKNVILFIVFLILLNSFSLSILRLSHIKIDMIVFKEYIIYIHLVVSFIITI